MIAFGCIIVTTKKAHSHDLFSHWKIPGTNSSCCNERKTIDGQETGDCEQAPHEIRNIDGDVRWWVYIRQIQKWIPVPDAVLLWEENPDPTGIDGFACWTPERGLMCDRPPAGVQ